MILTYKIKHNQNYTQELIKAKEIAEYAVKTKSRSSADVKHIGLKSAIANQILKKYGSNKVIKRVRRVNLIVPGQGINVSKATQIISIPCLKLSLSYYFKVEFSKINQVELDKQYAYVSVTVLGPELKEPTSWIGVDLNTTGHCAVAAHPTTGKVLKLGKSGLHIHKKYRDLRRKFQLQGKYSKVKQAKHRERNKIRDILHKSSKRIVEFALTHNAGIKLELLTGIRKRTKTHFKFNYFLNSWSFYALKNMIDYKAKLRGITVVFIDPRYTSQTCSKCGHRGNRQGKEFKCLNCKHVAHADVNAAFNIALRHSGIEQLNVDRDAFNGCTEHPKEATS
jgi:putative transposase